MRNQNRRVGLAAAAAVMLLAGTAQAATTTFTDKTAFLAGIATAIVDDFESPAYQVAGGFLTDAQMTGVRNETVFHTDFDSSGVYGLGAFGHVYCAESYQAASADACGGTIDLRFLNTSVSTANGVFAVGFDLPFAQNNFVSVVLADGTVSVFNLPGGGYSQTAEAGNFFGVQSTAGILRIVLQPTNVLTQSGYVLASPSIDNLVIGSSSFAAGVPEPATWALMIAGFFAVGAAARRRGRALAA